MAFKDLLKSKAILASGFLLMAAITFSILMFYPVLSIPNRQEVSGKVINWYPKDGNTLCNDVQAEKGIVFKGLICTRFIHEEKNQVVDIIYDSNDLTNAIILEQGPIEIILNIIFIGGFISVIYLLFHYLKLSISKRRKMKVAHDWALMFFVLSIIFGFIFIYRFFSVPDRIQEKATITNTFFDQGSMQFCYDVKTESGKSLKSIDCFNSIGSRPATTVSDFTRRVGSRINPIYFNSNDLRQAHYASGIQFFTPFIIIFSIIASIPLMASIYLTLKGKKV